MIQHSNATLAALAVELAGTEAGDRAAAELRDRDHRLADLWHPVPAGLVFQACATCARDEDACRCGTLQDIRTYGVPKRLFGAGRPVPVTVRPKDATAWRHMAGECTEACRYCKANAARRAAIQVSA